MVPCSGHRRRRLPPPFQRFCAGERQGSPCILPSVAIRPHLSSDSPAQWCFAHVYAPPRRVPDEQRLRQHRPPPPHQSSVGERQGCSCVLPVVAIRPIVPSSARSQWCCAQAYAPPGRVPDEQRLRPPSPPHASYSPAQWWFAQVYAPPRRVPDEQRLGLHRPLPPQ